MQYLGGKLSAAQLQVVGWMGSIRRSLQDALGFVWGSTEEEQQDDDEEDKEEEADGGGRFQRVISPLRSFARRSRRSLHRFSIRTLHRRATEPCSVKSYCSDVEDKDTDALIDFETDQQDGVDETTSEPDSPKAILDQVPEVSSEDADASDSPTEVVELSPFPEISTPFLDNQVQRSKVELGKRRTRPTRPPRSVRAGLIQTGNQDWRTCDSTEEKAEPLNQRDSDEEDQPKPKVVCSPPTAQRVPMIPGLSPAALLAQLKKRTAEGAEEMEEERGREEKDSPNEEVSASQLSRSPRPAARLAGAARVLPPLGGTDGGVVSSPAWLKELKSKKRLSQHDSET